MAKTVEVTGVFEREVWRSDNGTNFAIGKMRPDGKADGLMLGPDGRFGILGEWEPDELTVGMSYRAFGSWEQNERFGPQFRLRDIRPATPHGRAGVIRYLQQLDGVGQATATALWNKFQGDAVRILRESPDVAAAAVPRFKLETAQAAAEKLREIADLEDCSIELFDLLDGHGWPRSAARELRKQFGGRAAMVIAANPYLAMGICRGVGFLKADKMYLALGHPPQKLKRQTLCAWYSVADDNEGHVWLPDYTALEGIRAKVAGAEVHGEKAIALALRAKLLAQFRDCPACDGQGKAPVEDIFGEFAEGECERCQGRGGNRWLADVRLAGAESFVAERIAMAEAELLPRYVGKYESRETENTLTPSYARCHRCRRKLTAPEVHVLADRPYGPDCIQKVPGGEAAESLPLSEFLESHPIVERWEELRRTGSIEMTLPLQWPAAGELAGVSDHQREEYAKATTGMVGVLGGSPGTGKTHTTAALVKQIISRFGSQAVAIAAPTGKAAVRCREAMASHGISVLATTIHRLLGVEAADGGRWTFRHREGDPLPFQFVLLDESSMIDIRLMSAVFAARARGTHFLFIGDVDQLPPVGPGAPLRDFIAAGLPYGELREIHRNAGSIVRACASIRDNRRFSVDSEIKLAGEPPRNLTLVPATKGDIQRRVAETVDAITALTGCDPVWDIQVIVAVNKKSPASRQALNTLLQDKLNSHPRVAGTPFRVGDKVIQLANGFLRPVDGGDPVLVCNGEFGVVLSAEQKKTIVRFDAPRREVSIPKGVVQPKDDGEGGDDEKSSTGCDLDLAFAVTGHKLQGSSAPYTIVVLDDYMGATGPRGVCDRAWLYTAISRAEKGCWLVGRMETAIEQCRRQSIRKRKTFLVELIGRMRREYGLVGRELGAEPEAVR